MPTGTNLGRAGGPLAAARPDNDSGAHGVTRPAHGPIPTGSRDDTRLPLPRNPSSSRRLAREWKTMAAMVRCYCHDHHDTTAVLCLECQGLLDYATLRLDCCRFGAEKPTCVNCPVHCYKRHRREQMKAVMRHAGPRMLWQHPVLSLQHWLDGFRKVLPLNKETAHDVHREPQQQPFENLFLCRRRGDESQISSDNSIDSEPPHVGSYNFNGSPTIEI
ncbi:MAG: nitrous oxide-stimulated promoter family protein [Limisphaerales bacterium]